ncbi:hypothetical protein NL676_038509 [Syzygium grande]|nr:hypothetical protein NL676_038509 [Syzygium grande]
MRLLESLLELVNKTPQVIRKEQYQQRQQRQVEEKEGGPLNNNRVRKTIERKERFLRKRKMRAPEPVRNAGRRATSGRDKEQ